MMAFSQMNRDERKTNVRTYIKFLSLGLVLWAGLSAAADTTAVLEPPKYVGPPLPLQGTIFGIVAAEHRALSPPRGTTVPFFVTLQF